MLEKERYLALPSLQKEEYITNILKEILKHNPVGVTVSDIQKATYLSRSTVWHHIELLNAIGECIRLERGDTDVYHSNKVIASFNEFQLKGTKLDSVYDFELVENTFGKYVRLQRKRASRSEAHYTGSGIILPSELIEDVIKALNKIKDLISK